MSSPPFAGQPRSFWIETSDATTYPSLSGRVAVDVAVLGGGITGLAIAAHLKRAGMTVAVVEADGATLGLASPGRDARRTR